MSEWKITNIGDILTLQRGFDLPSDDRRNGTYPVVASTGIVGFHDQSMVKGPGVIIGRSGSIGGGQYIQTDFWPLNTTLWVKDFKGNNPRFCYYLLKSLDLSFLNAGSGVPTLNRNHVHPIVVPYPVDVKEQRAIAHILGTLDDKIELNRRMNETLEGIARALFKSWFIDFDPVRAKAEGRQPFGMNEETAALFPSEFEDSELGEIPKGWSIRSIYDIADVRYGAPFSSKLFNSNGAGFPLIRIRDLESQNPVVFTQERIDRDTVIHAGDILVGMDGEFKITTWYGPDSLLNQRVCSFIPKEGVPSFFLKYAIKTPICFFERSKVGTTVIHLGKTDIDSIRILVPEVFVLINYEKITKDIYDSIIYNYIQNNILVKMRDALLPKLISGKIRIDPSRFGFGPEKNKAVEV